MTSLTQIARRRGFCTLALLACVTAFAPQPAAARGGSADACVRWPQRHLVIGNDLQSRRFVLEPKGDLEPMPVFKVAEGRSIFHRPFSLLLDVGGKVSLFQSNAPKTCVLARDDGRFPPDKIPVFFVGRPGESLEELKDNAQRLAFDPSAPLDVGIDFSEATFHLRRGGSSFDAIHPFFLCGLAGLLVCEESCPEDTDTLAASLVNVIVSGAPETSQPSRRQEANAPSEIEAPRPLRRSSPPPALPALPRSLPRFTQTPYSPPPALEPAPLPPPRGRSSENATPPAKVECPPCAQQTAPPQKPEAAPSSVPQGQPPATATLPQKEAAPPPASQTQPSKNETLPPAASKTQPPEASPLPPKEEAAPSPAPRAQPPEITAPPPKAPQAEPTPQPKAPEAAPPSTPTPPSAQHIVLAFERKSGEALPAADVIQAEGSLSVEGVPLQEAPEGLTADVPAEAAKKIGDNATLKKLLRRYQLVTVRKEPDRLVLVVDPLYVRAEDLKIEIQNAAGEPVRGCELTLDVSADRQLGTGWAKLKENERLHGLEFAEIDSTYGLSLPADIEPNELLASTAEPGNAARIASTGDGCQLEARPWVSAEELRSKKIVRALKGAGQTLIAVFSTDSKFAGSLGGAAAAEGFWSDALRLVNVVSTAAWEKKVLGRAQAPVSPETGKLQVEGQGGALAGDGSRGASLKILSKGSQEPAGPASIFQVQPIERYHLDIVLKLIREDASIAPQYSVKQESLILVTGSVRETGSYFCQHSVRRDKSPWSSPQWVKQARRTFALEVWSAGAVDAMQRASRIKPAQNAPDGVYICDPPGTEGDKIVLYGITPKVVSDSNARAKAFSWLTGQANTFLKP